MDLTYRVDKKDDVDHIFLSGKINEDSEAPLNDLSGQLAQKVVFNFAAIKMINSCGVRAWITFLRDAQKSRDITFEECPPEIVSQVNMIPNFLGHAKINSVYAEYSCENCGHSKWRKFEKGKDLPESSKAIHISEFRCEKCQEVMEMEEIEDEFFSFIKDS
jgi:hypothetical protein